VATSGSSTASLITVDNLGGLKCDGKFGYLRLDAVSNVYDVMLAGIPPPDSSYQNGYFYFAGGSLSASLTRALRKRQAMFTVGVLNGQLVAGPNVSPNGLVVTQISVASASGSASSTLPSGFSTVSGVLTSGLPSSSSSSAAGSGGLAPIGSVPAVTTTQTVTLTVTQAGSVQTVVAVQVIINGVPSTGNTVTIGTGSGSTGLSPVAGSSATVTIFVNINNVFVTVSVGGIPVFNPSLVTIGNGLTFTVAPVIVNIVIVIAPVVYISAGITITGTTTLQAFVTAVANVQGLAAGGAGQAVTIVNSVGPFQTVTLTQAIAVPSVVTNTILQGGVAITVPVATQVPTVPGSAGIAAVAVQVPAGSAAVVAAAAVNAAVSGAGGVAVVPASGVAAISAIAAAAGLPVAASGSSPAVAGVAVAPVAAGAAGAASASGGAAGVAGVAGSAASGASGAALPASRSGSPKLAASGLAASALAFFITLFLV
jgi:hypothetical protein